MNNYLPLYTISRRLLSLDIYRAYNIAHAMTRVAGDYNPGARSVQV
jgi:hypothetical protein